MKTFSMGHLSPRHTYALLFAIVLAFCIPAKTLHAASPTSLPSSSWSASADIPCTAEVYTVSVDFYLPVSTFSYSANAIGATHQLDFAVNALTAESLPQNAVIALIQVVDSDSQCMEFFQVTTDGTGGLILIDNIDM